MPFYALQRQFIGRGKGGTYLGHIGKGLHQPLGLNLLAAAPWHDAVIPQIHLRNEKANDLNIDALNGSIYMELDVALLSLTIKMFSSVYTRKIQRCRNGWEGGGG